MHDDELGPTTLSELAAMYCREAGLRAPSVRNYQVMARIFERDTGITDVKHINRSLVAAWRDELLRRASASTWNTYRLHLRILFNYAIRLDLVDTNPFRVIEQIRTSKRKKTIRKHVLSDAIKYLRAAECPLKPGWFWIIIIKIFFYTGMRRRQLTYLRWRYIDFERNIILFVAEGSKTKREWEIPIPEACRADLLFLYKNTIRVIGVTAIADQQVFRVQLFNADYAGIELTPDQVSGFFRNLSNRLGEPITPHRLRHTMATELARGENPDLKSLQYILGHTNLKTTLEYVQPDQRQLQIFLAKLKLEEMQ